MKLLHLTDLHFNQRWFEWAARVATDFDAVVISGDLLHRDCSTPFDHQVAWARDWVLNFPAPLVLCSGLDDIDGMKRARWLEELAREQITVDRGVARFHDWSAESVPWYRLPGHGGEHHIVVAHIGPSGVSPSLLWPDDVDGGDERFSRHLSRAVTPPGIILCGNVHDSEGWAGRIGSSWVFNPGVGSRSAGTPNHIVLDLDRREARWVGNGLAAQGISFPR